MKTPICDFIDNYNKDKKIRLHMPGHKGVSVLGVEAKDITEIDGADYLYLPKGIIAKSEENASLLFGSDTFYSTEGSSQCIRAMLFLALTNRSNKASRGVVLATRNAHKTFITAAALLDFDVEWIYSKNTNSYHNSNIDASMVEDAINNMSNKPFAVYLTSPDYLGNILPIKKISEVCKKYNIPLLVDNAHGAYLRFIEPSVYPITEGALMCCDSAHKTLPALTGAAYLHISKEADSYYKEHAKEALSLFGSTSPSYLILQSLDKLNPYLLENKDKFNNICNIIDSLKEELILNGYKIIGNERMKITIDALSYGYTGDEISSYLSDNNIIVEFYDHDFVVLMPSLNNTLDELNLVKKVLISLKRKEPIQPHFFSRTQKTPIMSIKEATFSLRESVSIDDALGRILADTAVTCPPAIPIVVCGEVIEEADIEVFKYYGVTKCSVVKSGE
ncbi:MAG: aminotransferase class I/II-fold pyridoxal phosphate-dependent enzyme [Anaeroplasmataceae bacterium]